MSSRIIIAAAAIAFSVFAINELRKATPIECFIVDQKSSNLCECKEGKQPTKDLPSPKLPLPSKPKQDPTFEEYSSEIAKVIEICKGNKIFDAECISQTKHFSVAQLIELAGTDEFWVASQKNTIHYLEAYDQFFSKMVSEKNITVLEIGVRFGNSLRFWQRLLPNAQVVGLDIETKEIDLPEKIKIIQGDITKASDLQSLCNKYKNIKAIVEDSSHVLDHSIFAFQNLFPCLAEGGIYVIEDVMYDCVNGKICNQFRKGMEFFTNFIYGINLKKEQLKIMNMSNPIQNNLFAVHFYSHLIILQKKEKKR